MYVCSAEIAQLGERQTEDLKVPCSIHGFGKRFGVLWCWHPQTLDTSGLVVK